MKLSDVAKKIMEVDDDKYVSIGYGRYKLKGKEDDDNADVFTKTDSGQYVKSADQKSDDDKGGEEEPKGKGLGKGDFERDFDDGDPEDAWDDEEGRAKPTGKTDADAWEDDPVGEPSGEPKTFDDIKNHHSKAVSAQDKVNDMIDKHNADHQMQDDDYEKWEDKREELKAIENELQALTVDDPNDSSYDGYKKGQKELTKQYISTLNKLSPDAKKILNKEEGRTGTEEIKVINGKKYRAIQESVNKRIAVKEVYKWLKGLEEYRYRKIPNVDVRRITSFVNNGLSEIDLPKSLQKKWESAKYSKEKNLADRFVKQKISQKLTQTESKHPLKEQYDRLFTDRTVL